MYQLKILFEFSSLYVWRNKMTLQLLCIFLYYSEEHKTQNVCQYLWNIIMWNDSVGYVLLVI